MSSDVLTLYIKKVKIDKIKLSKYFLIFHQYITNPTSFTSNPTWRSPFAMKLSQIPWTPLYIHIYQKNLRTINYIGSIPLPLSTLSLNRYYKQKWRSPISKFSVEISFILKNSSFNPNDLETLPLYDSDIDVYVKNMAIDLPDPNNRCPYEYQPSSNAENIIESE